MTETTKRSLTPGILRAAIRTKIDQGIASRAVSALISTYAEPSNATGRVDGGSVQRLPVEAIPVEQRDEFLRALMALSSARSP